MTTVLTRENLVTAAFVAVAIPAAYAAMALAEGPVGEDATFAIGFATLLLVGVGAPSLYSRFAEPSDASAASEA